MLPKVKVGGNSGVVLLIEIDVVVLDVVTDAFSLENVSDTTERSKLIELLANVNCDRVETAALVFVVSGVTSPAPAPRVVFNQLLLNDILANALSKLVG